MSELPFELVIEILARVPGEELLRFRCVCKSWRSMFQDVSFIRKHTTHAPRRILYVNLFLPNEPPRICNYEDGMLKMRFKEPELNNGEIRFPTTIVIGHCDGLFCLKLVDRSFALWNPTLREFRKVLTINRHQNEGLIGFGYDHSIQDHKIVFILHSQTNFSKAQVLTLKSSVSRMIHFQWRKDWECSKKEGILVDGNIFWQLIVYENGIKIFQDIVTFNVVSETFNYCSSPKGGITYRELHVLRGSLCAVVRDTGDSYLDDMVVWCADHEKQDKGRIKSWSKILTLKASDIERATCWNVYLFRLETVLNQAGSLLVQVSTNDGVVRLCEYNLEEGTVSKVEASFPIRPYYFTKLHEYIATLVPARAY